MRSLLSGLLFWFMMLAGGGGLAASLLLPVVLEHQEKHRELERKSAELAQMEQRNLAIEVQIEHAKHDPAYLERLAYREFGIETPGVESVRIAAIEAADESPQSRPAAESMTPVESRLAQAEHIARHHPIASLFVLPQTRFAALVLCGAMSLAALLWLNPWTARGGAVARSPSGAG